MRKPRLHTAVVAAALGLALAACSTAGTEPTASDADESLSSTTETTPSSTSASSTPRSPRSPRTPRASRSEPTATLSVTEEPSATMTSPSKTTDIDVSSMLLPATDIGKLNAEWTWSTGDDFRSEPARLTACNRVGLEVIGAEKVAVREYTSRLDAGVRAHHLVAAFPDDVTARRAYSVLQSWRDGCRQRLERRAQGADGVKVSAAETVSTDGESAASYVVFQPTATGSTRIENVATGLDGSVVDLVVVKLEGEDFNYPRGRSPAAVGVRNAAGRSG